MEVHQGAGCQPGQHFEEEKIDVAVDLRHMRRVNEEDVAGLEHVEEREIDVLQARLNRLVTVAGPCS